MLRPARGRLLCRFVMGAERTAGGIVVPEKYREKHQEMVVLEVGADPIVSTADGPKVLPHDIKKGDRVLVNRYVGQGVKVDGQDLLMISWEDVLGSVE